MATRCSQSTQVQPTRWLARGGAERFLANVVARLPRELARHRIVLFVDARAVRNVRLPAAANLEGVPLRGPRWLQLLLQPVAHLSRWRHRHHIPHDLDGIERCLGLRPD